MIELQKAIMERDRLRAKLGWAQQDAHFWKTRENRTPTEDVLLALAELREEIIHEHLRQIEIMEELLTS